MVKCALCGGMVDKNEAVKYKGKNYHPKCYYENKDREELATYICELFSLKAPGPRNYALIKKFRENNGYTYRGIINSLKYFFEVKNMDKAKSNERIGIVPYIYDEAQEYFSIIEKKNKQIRKVVEKQIDTPKEDIKISIPKRNKKDTYCLENL